MGGEIWLEAIDSTGASGAAFPEFFPQKALQHDTTNLALQTAFFSFYGNGEGRAFSFYWSSNKCWGGRWGRETCHIEKQTSEKYYPKNTNNQNCSKSLLLCICSLLHSCSLTLLIFLLVFATISHRLLLERDGFNRSSQSIIIITSRQANPQSPPRSSSIPPLYRTNNLPSLAKPTYTPTVVTPTKVRYRSNKHR